MVEFIRWEKKEAHCKNCGAVLSYALGDVFQKEIELGYYKEYIICPKCHKEVKINA